MVMKWEMGLFECKVCFVSALDMILYTVRIGIVCQSHHYMNIMLLCRTALGIPHHSTSDIWCEYVGNVTLGQVI